MDTRAAIERFLESPALSRSTRRAYRVDLEEFGDWLGRRVTELDAVDALALAVLVLAGLRRGPKATAPTTS